MAVHERGGVAGPLGVFRRTTHGMGQGQSNVHSNEIRNSFNFRCALLSANVLPMS